MVKLNSFEFITKKNVLKNIHGIKYQEKLIILKIIVEKSIKNIEKRETLIKDNHL